MTRHLLRGLGALLVVYLLAPLALFAVRFVDAPARGFRVAGLFPSLLISLLSATVTLALTVVTGIPLAYVLGRSRSRLARLVEVAVTLPLALPPVMGGIVVVYLVGPYSFLGRHLGGQLTNSVYGIVIAMTFSSAPFLILSARAAFSSIDPALLDVAATLGHSELSRFVRVALPSAGPEIRAGMTMTWLRAFGEYGAVTILAYNPASLPIYTVNEFMARGLAPTLAPTMLALVVAAAVVLVSRARLPRRRHVDVATLRSEEPTLTRSARLDVDVVERLGDFELRLRHVAQHDNVAVLGPSGSGKSVLLRTLAGLYGSGVGRVAFGADDVSSRRPEQRRVGYVAQGFTLFAHLSVWGNLMFATTARPGVARYWLSHLRLEGLEDRMPAELSGGQRQRVALAQALCASPEVLLLDEPFSALDMPIRRELQRELRHLQRETGLATVIVTHDPAEAAHLAQEILVIDAGRLLQADATRRLFTRPASRAVARLLGVANLQRGVATEGGLVTPGGTRVAADTTAFAEGAALHWHVRPERIRVVDDGPAAPRANTAGTQLTGTLNDVAEIGVGVDLLVEVESGLELQVRRDEAAGLVLGGPCHLWLASADVDVWAAPDVTAESRVEPPAGLSSPTP